MRVEMACKRCAYNWTYKGSRLKASCPSCGLPNYTDLDKAKELGIHTE